MFSRFARPTPLPEFIRLHIDGEAFDLETGGQVVAIEIRSIADDTIVAALQTSVAARDWLARYRYEYVWGSNAAYRRRAPSDARELNQNRRGLLSALSWIRSA